jgi:hypothetical protein
MQTDIIRLWAMCILLLATVSMSNIVILKDRAQHKRDIIFINQRISDIKRTDEWVNSVYTNTIQTTCEFMMRQQVKQIAEGMRRSLSYALLTSFDRDPWHALGYENPTNCLTGTFAGRKYVHGILIGMETNEVPK